ncbi:polyphenol oxidase family protein [Moraxella haemolytica]|uniref:polyphenol oxidase family protein n=1 Tax=Moraxella haemolytica TaxID=2904119 RepID=UPI00254300B7|nr:laccase domain-containing protein [Moraxella sp. ZY171148]WII96114.1 polyphenol oxidase family protein [Moraxella sp. ZY171148]
MTTYATGTAYSDPVLILHHTPQILVAQSTAGAFEKFAKDDIYGQFNLALHVKDDPKQVLSHRATFLRILKEYGVHTIHWLNQTHSDVVVNVDECSPSIHARCADALIGTQIGQALAIMTADCVPIVIFGDDKHNDNQTPIACVHAGWQGLTNGIIKNTLSCMRQKQPHLTYRAIIGAHIRQSSYQITRTLGNDIITSIHQKQLTAFDVDALYHTIIKDSTDDAKCLIDLNRLAQLQLSHLGVEVIGGDVPCTYQDPRFYSYRAQTHANKPSTGRMAMVVVKLI